MSLKNEKRETEKCPYLSGDIKPRGVPSFLSCGQTTTVSDATTALPYHARTYRGQSHTVIVIHALAGTLDAHMHDK